MLQGFDQIELELGQEAGPTDDRVKAGRCLHISLDPSSGGLGPGLSAAAGDLSQICRRSIAGQPCNVAAAS